MKTRGRVLIWVVLLLALAVILRTVLSSRAPDPEYRAMWATAKTRCEEVSQVLVRVLSNRTSEIRRVAVADLGEMGWRGRSAVAALVRLLQDANPEIRVRAASSLGEIGVEPESVIPALAARLADPDNRVKRSAADAVARFGYLAVAVAPAMQELLESTNTTLVRTACRALHQSECEIRDGAIVRGPTRERKIAVVFTAHEFAEGGETILAELSRHQAKASFFLTGSFMTNANHQRLVGDILKAGHWVGPHSDRHLLYCSWDSSRKTLVEWHEFRADLINNLRRIEEREIEVLGDVSAPLLSMVYFLPPYEHYNRDIAHWTRELGPSLINGTPGTRSNADYTGEADSNFVSSQAIFDSILKKEREDPNGLNGFILLLHLGAGPGRADKFHTRLGELLDVLAARGYQFLRVDELLEPK